MLADPLVLGLDRHALDHDRLRFARSHETEDAQLFDDVGPPGPHDGNLVPVFKDDLGSAAGGLGNGAQAPFAKGASDQAGHAGLAPRAVHMDPHGNRGRIRLMLLQLQDTQNDEQADKENDENHVCFGFSCRPHAGGVRGIVG